MRHFLRVITFAIVFSVLGGNLAASSRTDFRVTGPETAIVIARAVFEQEFGRDEMRKIKSIDAELKGDKWVVYLHHHRVGQTSHGGTIDIEVAVERGSILAIKAEM